MPVMPCGARRTRSPFSISACCRIGPRKIARAGTPAEQARKNGRLDHDVAQALGHRHVELIARVGEADALHFAYDHAAILDLRAQLETLHRFVEVGLHHDLRLEQLAGAEHHQQEYQAIVAPMTNRPILKKFACALMVAACGCYAASATASRRKNWRTHGLSLVSRSTLGSPSAMMPFVRLSSMITRSAIA